MTELGGKGGLLVVAVVVMLFEWGVDGGVAGILSAGCVISGMMG